jgi:hypothetical protein
MIRTRTGVSLDAAVGWAGFAPVLKHRTQTEAHRTCARCTHRLIEVRSERHAAT